MSNPDPNEVLPGAADVDGADDDEVVQRLQQIIESTRGANELATSLIERIDALHERAVVVQAPALRGLVEQLAATHGQLSESLEREVARAHEAVEQAQAATEQARNDAESSADALAAQLNQFSQVVTDEVQATSTFLADRIEARVEQQVQSLQSGLDEALSKTQASWSRSQDDLHRAVDELLQKTGQSLSGAQSESLKASQDSLQRISQLKSEVDDCARALGGIIGTFSGLMGSTRTGLNVTAGTLSDVVSVFQEVS